MQKLKEIYLRFKQKKEAQGAHTHKKNVQDRGRSMVEMLGVLAIIGVLSISALFGYSYAMDKRRTNNLINEINLRTQSAMTQLVRQNTIDLSEFPQTVEATTIDWGYESPYILFEVKTLTERVCKMMRENSPAYWHILVDDTEGKACGESNILTIEILDTDGNTGGGTPDPDPDPDPDPEEPTCPEGTTPGTGADTGKCCAGGQCCPNGAAPGTGSNAGKCCLNEACCAAGQTPYCGTYNTNGTCKYASCTANECTQQPFPVKTGGACCTSSQTPFCSYYNADGACHNASCGLAGCTPAPFSVYGGSAVCCPSDRTPYCSNYNADGTCNATACGLTGCTQTKFDTAIACCTSNETPYCSTYFYGKCSWATCQAGECTQQPFPVSMNGVCCSADKTPYCYLYDSDGTCKRAGCWTGKCTPARIDNAGTCCTSNQTPYCSRYFSGICEQALCKTGECTQQPFPVTQYGDCCTADETPYCYSRYNNTCKDSTCCPAGQKVTVGSGNNPDTCT